MSSKGESTCRSYEGDIGNMEGYLHDEQKAACNGREGEKAGGRKKGREGEREGEKERRKDKQH